MGRYIPQQEIMKRLGDPDHKTLRRWCIEARITPRKRPHHGNKLWYTGTQLQALVRVARSHGRQVEEGQVERDEGISAEVAAFVQEEVRRQVALLRQELLSILPQGSPTQQADTQE